MSTQEVNEASAAASNFGQSYLQLATRACNGDDNAFGILYERIFPQIFDFLARLVGNRELGEELAQESFVVAFEQRHRLRNPAAMRSWLFSIAYHRAMDYLRRANRERPGLTEGLTEGSAEGSAGQAYEIASEAIGGNMIAAEAAELVWSAAQSLKADQYAILDLNLRQGLSGVELARALGTSPASASIRLHRAKNALGRAVQALLVARNPYHCDKLAALVPRLATSTVASWSQQPYLQVTQQHSGQPATYPYHGGQAAAHTTARGNPDELPETQAHWLQAAKAPIVLSGTERSRVVHHLANCDSCGRLARNLTAPSALLGSFIMLTPNAHFSHFDLTSAHILANNTVSSHTPAGHIKSYKDTYLHGGGRMWSRAIGLRALSVSSVLLIIVGSAGGAYLLHNGPHTISAAASRNANPVGATNRSRYTHSSTTSAPGITPSTAPTATPSTAPTATPSTAPTATPVPSSTTPPAQTPDLYITTGAILGSLYSWPDFPSTIQLYNTGYLGNLSWVSSNPQSASAHGIYVSCNYALPGPCSGNMVSSQIEIIASDPQYCTVKIWNQTTGQSSFVHAYIFDGLDLINTGGSTQQPPFTFKLGTQQSCTP